MRVTSNLFREQAAAALKNQALQAALQKLNSGFDSRRKLAISQLEDYEALREEAYATRQYSLAHLDDLLLQFEHQVQGSGGEVHWAETPEQARALILNICQKHKAKLITKGKSMVAEEIELNDFLKQHGITPVETDFGEYVLQIREEAPSHIVVPAVHLQQQQMEQSFRQNHALAPHRNLQQPEALVDEAREVLRPKFLQADVGITGANFLIAETGSAVIVTNEGNGDLTQTLPKVHIVLTTIERVIPTLNDLASFLRLLPRAATGQSATSYVTVTTGIKHNDDLAGPEEFHVILLDNHRTELLGTPEQNLLHCIRCGACMNACPVYKSAGGHSYGWVYPGPIGAALTPALVGLQASQALPQASTFCGKCDEVCPVKIPLTAIMRGWRTQTWQKLPRLKTEKRLLKTWAWWARHPRLYRKAVNLILSLLKTLNKGGKPNTVPMAKSWLKHRDLPVLPPASFHQQLQQTLKHNNLPGVRHE